MCTWLQTSVMICIIVQSVFFSAFQNLGHTAALHTTHSQTNSVVCHE